MSALAEAVRPDSRLPAVRSWPWTSLLRLGSLAAVALALGAGALLGEPEAIVVALLGLGLGLAVVWLPFRGDERRFLLTLLLVGFALRIVVAVAAHFALLAVGNGGFLLLDDRAYDKLGWTLARVWMGIFPGIRDTDQYLMVNYTYLVAAIYFLLGHSLLAAKMMNVAFGAILAVATYALTAEILTARHARIAAVLVAVFPSLVTWSAINLKDILVVLLTTTAVFGLVRFARRHEWWAFVLLMAATLAIENLRQFVFFILAWGVPVAFLFTDRSGWRRKLILVVPLIVGMASLNYVTSNEKFGTNFLTPKALTEAEWKRWLEERNAQTGINEESIKPPRDMSTIVERSVTYLPRGIFYVIFGPMPWEARSGSARAVIPEMLAWYVVLAAALAGLILSFRRRWRDLVLPVGFTGTWMLALALTEGNTGNIFRHRSQFMPYVFLLAAVGLAWVWDRRRSRRGSELLPPAGDPSPARGAP